MFPRYVSETTMLKIMEQEGSKRIGNGILKSWITIHPEGTTDERTIQLDYEPFSGKGRGPRGLDGTEPHPSSWL